MDDNEPVNVDVKCLQCWKVFVTGLDSIESMTAKCPKCGSGVVAKQEDTDD